MNHNPNSDNCGFCGKSRSEVKLLFQGKTAFICDTCIRGYQGLLSAAEKASQPQQLAPAPLPQTISIEEFWYQKGCPTPPETYVLDSYTAEQADEVSRAVQIVKMFERIQSKGWNERSVNARAQRRWPQAKYIIEDIDAIQSNWFRLGMPGLIAMVERGRSDFYSMRKACYHPIFHEVTHMTAVEVMGEPKQPVFIGNGAASIQTFHPERTAKVYSVALESQFGRYQFNMVDYQPPAPPEASSFACLHTKIG